MHEILPCKILNGGVYFVLLSAPVHQTISATHSSSSNNKMYGSHARQFIVPKQDNVWFPSATECGSQSRQSVVPKQDNVSFSDRTICGSHRGPCVFPKQETSNGRKIARITLISTILGRNRSRRSDLVFQKFWRRRKLFRVVKQLTRRANERGGGNFLVSTVVES